MAVGAGKILLPVHYHSFSYRKPITVLNCPNCSNQMQCPDEFAGKKVACTKCGQKIMVPSIAKTKLGKAEETDAVVSHPFLADEPGKPSADESQPEQSQRKRHQQDDEDEEDDEGGEGGMTVAGAKTVVRGVAKGFYVLAAALWLILFAVVFLGGLIVLVLYTFAFLPNLDGVRFIVLLPFLTIGLYLLARASHSVAEILEKIFPQ